MYYFIEGEIAEKTENIVVINCNGIGFLCHISLKTFLKLSETGQNIRIYTYHLHKDDVSELYGFYDKLERDFFLELITVSGIGARLALKVLSTLDTKELISAVIHKDIKILNSISGIGKKTAEMMILQLQEKFEKNYKYIDKSEEHSTEEDTTKETAINALISLGYTEKDARITATKIINENKEILLEDLIKESLKLLANL